MPCDFDYGTEAYCYIKPCLTKSVSFRCGEILKDGQKLGTTVEVIEQAVKNSLW